MTTSARLNCTDGDELALSRTMAPLHTTVAEASLGQFGDALIDVEVCQRGAFRCVMVLAAYMCLPQPVLVDWLL